MGYGLIGAGAAVSGLVDGYQKGRRFVREEEEAEDRKKLRELQLKKGEQDLKVGEQGLRKGDLDIEEAGLRLGRVKAEDNIAAESKRIWGEAQREIEDLDRPPAPVGAIATPTPATVSENGVETYAVPNEAPAPKPRRSVFQIRQDAFTKLLELQASRPGANTAEILKQAMGAARMFKQAETQDTLALMEAFKSGNMTQEQIAAELQKQGRPMLPGTQMRIVDKPMFEGSKQTFKDVEIVLPDGRGTVSMDTLSQSTMDPEKLFDARTRLGQLMATVSHHSAMEQIARDEAKNRQETSARHHSEVMSRMNAQIEQQRASLKLQEDKFIWDKFINTQTEVSRQFERAFQYTPLTEDQRIKIEREGKQGDLDKAEARNSRASARVGAAMLTWSMNVDPVTLKPRATAAEVKAALEIADPKLLKTDSDGVRRYVMVGETKVYVPTPGSAEPAAAPAPAPGAAPGAPARPGIAPPPGAAPAAAGPITDDQIRTAIKQYGAVRYKDALLGPRPGIRAGGARLSEWDRQANELDARLQGVLSGSR